jgi:hypothetical protein
MKQLFVLLLLVSKPCFVATLHEPMSHESPPIVIVHDPLWIIEPTMESPVPVLYATHQEPAGALFIQGLKTDSDYQHALLSDFARYGSW